MTELAFLSPDRAAPEAVWRSPLERALAHAPEGIEDVSRTGKIEVRGNLEAVEVEAEVVRITPQRALVLCPPERTAEVRERLQEQIELAIDMSAAWTGMRLRGETLMRRLSDLDLGHLPAVGSVAHVQAIVIRDEGETFRLFFPQEYGHYLAEAVLDTAGCLAPGHAHERQGQASDAGTVSKQPGGFTAASAPKGHGQVPGTGTGP